MKAHQPFLALLILLLAATGQAQLQPTPKVIGGITSSVAYPFMAQIISQEPISDTSVLRYRCGGTLIAPRWVLTAAHCLKHEGQVTSASHIHVFIGQPQRRQYADAGHRLVVALFVNPDFQGQANDFKGDIALLHLDSNVSHEFDGSLTYPPLSLATPAMRQTIDQASDNQPVSLRTLGWGASNNDSNSFADLPALLQQADLQYLPLNECRHSFNVDSSQVCAIDPAAQQDICQGDSGGPLMVQLAGQVQLLGITSFGGLECAQAGVPAVFTSVPFFLNDIERIINSHQLPGEKGVVLLSSNITPASVSTNRLGKAQLTVNLQNQSHQQTAHQVGFRLLASQPIKVTNSGNWTCSAPAREITCSSSLPMAAGASLQANLDVSLMSSGSDVRIDLLVLPEADEFNLSQQRDDLLALYFQNASHFSQQVVVDSVNLYNGSSSGHIRITSKQAVSLLSAESSHDNGMAVRLQSDSCQPLCQLSDVAAGDTLALSYSGNSQQLGGYLTLDYYDTAERGTSELISHILPARLQLKRLDTSVAAPPVVDQSDADGGSTGFLWLGLLALLLRRRLSR